MNAKQFLTWGLGICVTTAMVITLSKEIDGDVSSEPMQASKENAVGNPFPEQSEGLETAQDLLNQVSRGIKTGRQAQDEERQALLAEAEKYRRLGEEHRKKQAERSAAKASKERAKQEWWEDRKDWIENFPFEPSFHPTMTFQASNQGTNEWGHWKWNVNNPDEERMMLALGRHTFVRAFYENPARFDRAFEKLHGILDDYGYGENVERLGNTYSVVIDYHEESAKAAEDPHGRVPGFAHNDRGYYTWEESAEHSYEAIAGNMEDKKRLLPGEEPMPPELAEEIRERILAEISPEEFTGSFAYNIDYRKEVQPGDRLLMK